MAEPSSVLPSVCIRKFDKQVEYVMHNKIWNEGRQSNMDLHTLMILFLAGLVFTWN